MWKRKNLPGQAIVEFALVLPLLLLLIYGTVEVSRLIFIYLSVNNASRQAARYGATAGLGDSAPRYLDCEGIREAANKSAIIVAFDEINITYDRGATSDGEQIPITGIDPSPATDTCPIEGYAIRNGDRIIVQVSASYEPVISVIPVDPLEIVSSSARTFLVSVPILGSALPSGFSAETSTPSKLPSETSVATTTAGFTNTAEPPGPLLTIVPPPTSQPPVQTAGAPSETPLPVRTPAVTATAPSCAGLTGLSHGPLTVLEDYMEMEIFNDTGHTLATAQVYLEWNHDNGHQAGLDKSLHMRQASLGPASWQGDLLAPSTYVPGFYPPVPEGKSYVRFIFHQAYEDPDGTERIVITIGTPGCVNYPLDSRN